MDYRETKLYIKDKEKLGSIPGLVNIKELLSRLGNPEKDIPAIHIAGTNGKGSIMAFVEETLVEAGMKVGRYISPTIYSYRERWRLNKRWASKEDIALAITEVSLKVEGMVRDGFSSPTAFEIETAASFWLFKYWGCDIMLVECGMGGRLDATNVLRDDTLNVLASISMDHMSVLGNTIQEITHEKLGIVKDGSTLVTYPQSDVVMKEVREYAEKHNVHLIEADMKSLKIRNESFHDAAFEYKGESYNLSLGGEYQIFNAMTAVEVLKAVAGEWGSRYLRTNQGELSVGHSNVDDTVAVDDNSVDEHSSEARDVAGSHADIIVVDEDGDVAGIVSRFADREVADDLACEVTVDADSNESSNVSRDDGNLVGKLLGKDTIYEGILATKWDGRFTVAKTSPLVIVDGAHNEDAWLRLRESLDKYFTNEKIIYIMGVFADKEYDKMIRILAPTMKKCYTVESDSPRALSAAELAGKLRLAGVEAESVGDVKLAIDYALDRAGRNDRIVVCGTLSITGAALKYLNK